MQIDRYTSDKIRVMSFVSIILVLYIHSGFHDIPGEIQGMKANFYLQEAVSGMLGRMTVPLFFMISGMLFFRNIKGIKDVLNKMKKRARTLLLPFLIAALFLPVVYLVMGQLPWTAKFINGGDMFSKANSVLSVLQSLYLFVPGGDQPWGFHLWFLRDLVIIVAMSPVLYLARKWLGGGHKHCGVVSSYLYSIENQFIYIDVLVHGRRLVVTEVCKDKVLALDGRLHNYISVPDTNAQ